MVMVAVVPLVQANGQAFEAPHRQPIMLTILYDNTSALDRVRSDWGFALLVETDEHSVLFDTGADGALLRRNMDRMGAAAREIDVIVLSHPHLDHVGGVFSLLEDGITPPVYAPPGFPLELSRRIESATPVTVAEHGEEILPGMRLVVLEVVRSSSNSRAPLLYEQALVIDTASGPVIVTGCAHPGVVPLVRSALNLPSDGVQGRASSEAPGVRFLIGGFHLMNATDRQLERVIDALRRLHVHTIVPCHCTGEAAIHRFGREFGDSCLPGGAGTTFVVD
jgi:7,8-dihydropterin-6-yl-methyl-4-(beta-D-ribofuranosyl)aminobenzene 5'-phosphate synthase